MNPTQTEGDARCIPLIPKNLSEEVTETDETRFWEVVETRLTEVQEREITESVDIHPEQKSILAIHWHPENVPLELVERRIRKMYPKSRDELIIPTQHNQLMAFGRYSGVEIDCYSGGFNQKVQLLLHFETGRLAGADVLKGMLAHTFQYRSSQLYDFLETAAEPRPERISPAAKETGADEFLVEFVRILTRKLKTLLVNNASEVPSLSIKNKLIRNFFDKYRDDFGDELIDRAQLYLTAVKKIVKADFPLAYFYRTSEVIEEARSLGAGIVIPHPEQFWPILLADYDVDGVEVWNPQSHRYTNFLISVLNRKNGQSGKRRMLAFMGDDTHLGEKLKDPRTRNPEKSGREIGLQSAWEDLEIRKTLIKSNFNRDRVIQEYRERLNG